MDLSVHGNLKLGAFVLVLNFIFVYIL